MRKLVVRTLVGCALVACSGKPESQSEMDMRASTSGGQSSEAIRMARATELELEVGGPRSIAASSRSEQPLVVTVTNATTEPLKVVPAMARVAVLQGTDIVEGCEGEAQSVSLRDVLRPDDSAMVGVSLPCSLDEPGEYSVQVELILGEDAPDSVSVADTRLAGTMDLEVKASTDPGQTQPGLADPGETPIADPHSQIDGVAPLSLGSEVSPEHPSSAETTEHERPGSRASTR